MRRQLLFYSMVALSLSSYGQINQFQVSHDLGSDDYVNDLYYHPLFEELVATGSSTSSSAGGYDALFTVFDDEGGNNGGGVVGDAGEESGRSITVNAANQTTIFGSSGSYTTATGDGGDLFIAHLGTDGSPLWVNIWGTDSTDAGHVVIEGNDGSVVIAGNTKRRNEQRTDVLVVKLDAATGDTVWAREIGQPFINEGVYDMIPIGDGYALTGWSGSNAIGLNDVLMLVLDEDGNKQLAFYFGGPGEDDGRAFISGDNDSFYIAGNTRNIGAGSGDAFLAKFNSESLPPTLDWFKTYGQTGNESVQTAIRTDDGSIYLTGTTNSFGNGQEGFILKTNADGVAQWANVYGGSGDDYLQSIVEHPDGGLMAAGYSNSFGGTDNDMWVVGIDAAGNSTCNQTSVTFTEETISSSVAYTDFTHFSIAEITSPSVTLNKRLAIPSLGEPMVTSNVLCLTTGVEDGMKEGHNQVRTFPVPTTDDLTIELDEAGQYTVLLYSVHGKIVKNLSLSGSRASIDISDLIPGTYTLVVENKNNRWFNKVVKTN